MSKVDVEQYIREHAITRLTEQKTGFFGYEIPTRAAPDAVSSLDDILVKEFPPGSLKVIVVGGETSMPVAQAWQFAPTQIEVPAGSEVTFFITSKDIIHGFKVFDTNVNIMVIPGQISEVTHTFDEPGEFEFYCHEYCGSSHHIMSGVINVTGGE